MEIKDIKNPNFLKDLNINELNVLAEDIRKFLIDTISNTGGHLASNLGVVELTIALHYVFNTPQDKILFDVGHQSYIHKILTGRANNMQTLRKFNGLSGFQKRDESIYDCFEAGHSSTALSASLGMAIARDLNHEKYHIIPIVGDASLTNGLSLEALNQIGDEQRPIIIIFNDNNMSISKNVGALTRGFAKMRYSNPYNNLKDDVKSILKNISFGDNLIKSIHDFKDIIKDSIVDSGIFKEFNIDYIGPVDGHNIDSLIKALKVAKKKNIPCVVHCVTKKGYGYEFAQNDDDGTWHGVGKFDISTGKFLFDIPEGYISSSKAISDTVLDLMKIDEDIITLTPAMISGSALTNIFSYFPQRSFDCGIAEEHTLMLAAGLALNKKKPFIAIYSSFLQRAYDQLNHDICRMNLPVVIGVDRAGLVGEDGETHHGVFDISFSRSLPNIIITEGKDADENANLLYSGFKYNRPIMVRYAKENIPIRKTNEYSFIEIGKWEYIINNDNEDAIIISYGFNVVKIKDIIIENKLNYSLINARFIKPIDEILLEEILMKNKKIFIYTNDILKGGLGDEILEYINKKNLNNKVYIFGIDDIYVKHGTIKQLKESLNIDLLSLFKYIERTIND